MDRPYVIRLASDADMPAVLDIYNASIATTSTWSDTPETIEQRLAWFDARQDAGDGVLVADDEGEVVGFAAYGPFRDNDKWPGYRYTVENTVHVRASRHGEGIGFALMEALVEHAIHNGKHTMVAAVDGENPGSIAFHEVCGFIEVARLPELGWKFGRWLDLVLLQRLL